MPPSANAHRPLKGSFTIDTGGDVVKDTGGNKVGAYDDATKTVTCRHDQGGPWSRSTSPPSDATGERVRSRSADAIDVSTQAGADSALATIDNAIDRSRASGLTSVRCRTVCSTPSTACRSPPENASAAESRIRDTDMAKEMTSFTRIQILQQAGVSMLAQANQAPQSVLKLLG